MRRMFRVAAERRHVVHVHHDHPGPCLGTHREVGAEAEMTDLPDLRAQAEQSVTQRDDLVGARRRREAQQYDVRDQWPRFSR